MDNTPSKLHPALIGGAVIAVLSTIPVINFGNCFCCMWVILGGLIAAYVYQNNLPGELPFTSSDGALVGLLAGIFGALFGTLLHFFFMAVVGTLPARDVFETIMDYSEDIPPEVEEILNEIFADGSVTPLLVFVQLFFSLIIDSAFGLIGGLIGAGVFKRKPAQESDATK